MSDGHTNFLGIPVDGDITRGEVRKAQRPLEEFEPIVRAVLDDLTIVEFGWTQYTPYFNDGDPCVFGVNALWVRTDSDADTDKSDEGLAVDYDHPSLGKIEYEYFGDSYPREKKFKSYEGPDQVRLERCLELNAAIKSGAFDNVLIEAFGDHSDVTIRKTGIMVDSYDHD